MKPQSNSQPAHCHGHSRSRATQLNGSLLKGKRVPITYWLVDLFLFSFLFLRSSCFMFMLSDATNPTTHYADNLIRSGHVMR